MADRHFRQLGRTTSIDADRVEVAAHAGWHLPRFGSLAVAYVQRMNMSGHEAAFISTNYSHALGRWAFLSLSVTQDLYSHGRPGMFASITQPLGRGRSVQYAAHSNDDESGVRTEVHGGRVDGAGLSYRVAGENGSSSRVSGEGHWQGRAGTVAMGIAHRDGVTGMRATASGGVGLLGGDLYALRRIEDNFAVVEVPQQAGVPIYLDNRLVAHTDAEGRAAITGLRPHERNRISIDPVDLPLSVGILDASVEAVPKGRGGILVQMPVQAARGMLIRLLLSDGSPVPAGARLALNGREYPVAFEGRAYIDQLGEGGLAHVRWAEGECETLVKPDARDSLANATDVMCTGSRAERAINDGAQ
jgi:outer membrane usher protein